VTLSHRYRLRVCAVELFGLLDEPLVHFLMLHALHSSPSDCLPPTLTGQGLGVCNGLSIAAAAFAGALPRAVSNAHLISEINSADLFWAVRPNGLNLGGLDVAGDMLVDFQLQQYMSIGDDCVGFPNAEEARQVTFVFLCLMVVFVA
jgi:hypothetical protein